MRRLTLLLARGLLAAIGVFGLLSLAGCPDEGGDPVEVFPKLYVLNQGDGTMFILNAKTLERVDSVNLGAANPHFIEFSPDGQHYYVVSRTLAGMVSKFQTSDNAPVGSYTTPFDFQPTAIAITPNGLTGYVVNFGGVDISTRTKILKLDLTTMTLIPTNMTAGAMTHDARCTADGKLVVVCNMMSNDVTIIHTDADTITTISIDPDSLYPTPTTKFGPYGVCIDNGSESLLKHGDGGPRAFIACQHGGQVRVVDLEDFHVTDSLHVPGGHGGSHDLAHGPTQMCYDRNTDHLFVTTQFDNLVYAVHVEEAGHDHDEETSWEIPLAATQPFGVVISDDGQRVYVACVNAQEKGWVYMIDNFAHPPAKVDSAQVGKMCYGLAWQPARE